MQSCVASWILQGWPHRAQVQHSGLCEFMGLALPPEVPHRGKLAASALCVLWRRALGVSRSLYAAARPGPQASGVAREAGEVPI